MDWLRCNKCYRAMRDTTRNFSMTQCGHVYCGPCLEQSGEKCHECGNVGFQVMALGKPPKLESIINYFSPLEDFMQVCYKAAQFQESQMAIAVMGFQYMEKKYEALKTACTKVASRVKELKADCQRLREEEKNIVRVREAQQRAARSVQVRTSINPTNKEQHRVRREQSNRCVQGPSFRQFVPQTPATSGSSARYCHVPGSLERPAAEGCKTTPKMHTPESPYNPSQGFSNAAYHAAGSTTDSGRSSMAFNSGDRVEGFLVPSIQRVPKSAATAKRKTPTSVRLSVAKNVS